MNKRPQKGVEFEGTTVEDAISKALKELNATRDQVSIKIVCEEKKGLFGMEGAKPAKIKVSFKEDE
ncbi:MAG: Jag N-terminal domain-containing protein [Candidatus Omnitrophica bacterium]|nr:Jag N-terminal domain-containing protein [Candidatus Omnitrophota bacterium]